MNTGSSISRHRDGDPCDTPRHDLVTRVPATPAQCALWSADQLGADGTTTNVVRVWRVTGAFDPDAFFAACAVLAATHDSLRSTLHQHGDGLEMEIGAGPEPDMQFIDLRSRPETLTPALDNACVQGFDLRKGPLFRACVFQTGNQTWAVSLAFHHAIMDGWSIKLFCATLSKLYANPQAVPTRARYDFGDFARAEAVSVADRAARQTPERSPDSLVQPQPLVLPYDFALAPTASQRCEQTRFEIARPDHDCLKKQARAWQVGAPAILMAAFRLALFEITGQRCCAIGHVALGRPHAGLAKVLGAFVQTRAVISEVVTGMDAKALCQAEEGALTVSLRQSDGLAERRPDAVGKPALQVALNYRRYESRALPLAGCRTESIDLVAHSSPFDLVVTLDPSDGGLVGSLHWNAARFSEPTARRIADQYCASLRHLLSSDTPAVDSVAGRGAERVLHGPALAPARLVPELLGRAFDRHKDRPAIMVGEQSWSFEALNRKSADWARSLTQSRTALLERSGGLVALALPRGAEFIAAMIGIWRSGNAMIPLAQDDPPDRLRALLEDARPDHLIAEPHLAEALGWPALSVGTHAGGEQADAPTPTSRRALAYVMYTSGSTGKPKGVAVPHEALATLVTAACDRLDPQPGARMLSASAVTFDSLFFECLVPLVTGGTLVLMEDAQRKDPWQIADTMRRADPQYFFATPTQWRLLLDAEMPESPGLTAWAGGEALDPALARDILDRVGGLYNGYGPTETTVFATWHKVPREALDQAETAHQIVPIGTPLPGYSVAVVTLDGRPCWPGAMGEIWIGGPAVAEGYLRQDGLLATHFVSDPPDLPKGRWYKTGDLGQVRADGTVAYHGRIDGQVKIGGQRIEPAEIEAHIMASGLTHAAGVVRVSQQTISSLVAWVVMKPDTQADAIRTALTRRLPKAWVPRLILTRDSLPVTPSGKLDRVRLSREAAARLTVPDTDAAAPPVSNPVEQVWTEVLGAPPRHPDQDFFDAGGSSVLLIRILSDLRRNTGRHISVADAFDVPTARGLTALFDRASLLSLPSDLTQHRAGEGGDAMVFLPGINPQGHNLTAMLEHLPASLGVYGLERPVLTSENARFDDIAARCARTLRVAFPQRALHVTGFSLGAAIAFETACALARSGATGTRLTLIDTAPVLRKLNPVNPAFSRDARAIEYLRRNHRFSVWTGDLSLLRGDRNALLSLAMLANGWEDFVTGDVAVHMLPATHADLIKDKAQGTALALLGRRAPEFVLRALPGADLRRRAAHHISDGDHAAGLACLEQAAGDHPEHPWACVVADSLAQSLGEDRPDLLRHWLGTTTETPPVGIPALAWHAGRANAHARLGETGAALLALERARRDSPMIRDLEVQYASLLHINQRAEQASTVLRAAAKRWGPSPAIGMQLGISLAKQGLFAQALPYLRQGVTDFPKHDGARIWLDRASAC